MQRGCHVSRALEWLMVVHVNTIAVYDTFPENWL